METLDPKDTNAWIRIFDPAPGAAVRLICCPHAGGSAGNFRALSGALPGAVEALAVQYPGRPGAAQGEPLAGIPELAERIADRLPAPDGRPLAVLGHSMGSVVAFELTRRLEQLGLAPVRLFVSGRRAPAAGLGLHAPRNDEEIIAELRALGGVPPKLLDRPKYRASILTVIRDDYRLNSGYSVAPDTAVSCPVTFLLSDADPYVDRAAALGWRRHTTGDFRVAEFRGGHFFINDQLPEVTRVLAEDLNAPHRIGDPR